MVDLFLAMDMDIAFVFELLFPVVFVLELDEVDADAEVELCDAAATASMCAADPAVLGMVGIVLLLLLLLLLALVLLLLLLLLLLILFI